MTSPDLLSIGWQAIDWIEFYLVHGPGDVEGESIQLDDEFAAFIVKAYQVSPKSGARVVRRAFLSRAKGRSKSGLAAMIECFEALGPCRFDHWAVAGEVSDWGYVFEEGEPVGAPLRYVEALNVATEEDQAGNTYDAVYYMLNRETCSPELLERFGPIDVGLTRINLPDHRGFIEPVTSADASKDGGKSTFIVADETHLWTLPRLHRLHGVMNRNLLKRKIASGWMLETSTMYAEGEGSVAEGTHAYARSKAPSRRSLLFDHRQASDHWDLSQRKDRIAALKEAYGPAAAWMNIPGIADSWDDPQVTEAAFRRFWLNQPVPLTEPVDLGTIFGPFAVWLNSVTLEPADVVASVGLAMTADRNWISLVGAGVTEFVPSDDPEASPVDRVVVAPILRTGDVDAALAALKDIQDRTQCVIVCDEKGPASTLLEAAEEVDVAIETRSLGGFATDCADFFDAITAEEPSIFHLSNAELDAQVRTAEWKWVNDQRVIARRNREGVVESDLLEAAILAAAAAVGSGVFSIN